MSDDQYYKSYREELDALSDSSGEDSLYGLYDSVKRELEETRRELGTAEDDYDELEEELKHYKRKLKSLKISDVNVRRLVRFEELARWLDSNMRDELRPNELDDIAETDESYAAIAAFAERCASALDMTSRKRPKQQ